MTTVTDMFQILSIIFPSLRMLIIKLIQANPSRATHVFIIPILLEPKKLHYNTPIISLVHLNPPTQYASECASPLLTCREYTNRRGNASLKLLRARRRAPTSASCIAKAAHAMRPSMMREAAQGGTRVVWQQSALALPATAFQ